MEESENLVRVMESVNVNLGKLVRRQSLFHAFVSGLFSGLGSVMGATVVVAFLLWILGRLQLVPVFGAWVASVVKVVQQNLAIH